MSSSEEKETRSSSLSTPTPPPKKMAATSTDLHVTSIFAQQGQHAVVDEDAASDDRILSALGYKQEFKRDFSLWESFSVSFSILGVLPSIASTFAISLGYAGTGGAVWGWLIAAFFVQFVALAMSELCSSMPTAGGLYYAAAVLAPEGWGPFFSWVVGYTNLVGFGVGPCSLNYAFAAMLVTAGEIAYPEYTAQPWHTYLVLLGLLALSALVAMQSTWLVGWINKVAAAYNVVIVLIFVIWLPVGSVNSPKTSGAREVFTTFTNGTEWPVGWAVIMGFTTVLYTLAGYDAAFHVSEECKNANIAGPRAILMTAQSGLYLGWAVILVIAFTVTNVTDVVSGEYGQPFGSLCLQVLGQKAGLALFSLNMIAQFFCAQGVTVVAARIIFAFARDGALPGSRYLSRVNKYTKTPVNATWFITLISALVGLLLFAGPVAINAVFSVAAIGQYTSFTIPVALKLFDRTRFRPGPWHLGRYSRPIGAVVVCWWLLILPALCFPAVKGADLNADLMNWTCLIYGGVLTIALIYYAVSGRHWFKGPKVNVEHISDAAARQVKETS